jgi:hypothetical protein
MVNEIEEGFDISGKSPGNGYCGDTATSCRSRAGTGRALPN